MNNSFNRNKLSNLGKQIYDKLSPILPHDDWNYLIFMYLNTEEKKKIFMEFLNTGNKDIGEISDFLEEQFDDDMHFVGDTW